MQTEAKWCPFWQKLHFWLYTGQSILLVWRCCLPQNLHFLFPEWLFFFCYSSLLSFSFFATWLPPEIPAFSFLCCVYFFFSWSIVGFHGRRLLTDQSGQCRELYGVWLDFSRRSFLFVPFSRRLMANLSRINSSSSNPNPHDDAFFRRRVTKLSTDSPEFCSQELKIYCS